MTIVRTITVEIHEDNSFTVREGDSYCPDLRWDEMLGTIAELTHPRLGTTCYRMLSTSQHALHQRRREERTEAQAAQSQAAELDSAIRTILRHEAAKRLEAGLLSTEGLEAGPITCWPYTEQK